MTTEQLNKIQTKLFRDIEKIRDAIAEKVIQFVYLVSGVVICGIISFSYGWKLSLVIVSYIPIVMITNAIIGKVSLFLKTILIA